MVFSKLFLALINLIDLAARAYEFAIIARAIMSWFNPNPYNKFYIFINQITEPFLSKIRYYMNKIIPMGGIDFSPLIALLLVDFVVRNMIITTLYQIAYNM